MDNYRRDLVSRQNKSLTTAQIHSISNSKKYYNKDIEEASLMTNEQIDLLVYSVKKLKEQLKF